MALQPKLEEICAMAPTVSAKVTPLVSTCLYYLQVDALRASSLDRSDYYY